MILKNYTKLIDTKLFYNNKSVTYVKPWEMSSKDMAKGLKIDAKINYAYLTLPDNKALPSR